MTPAGIRDDSSNSKRVMPHLDADQIAELVAGYAFGVRVTELVKQFHVDQTTVQKYVRRAGLPRRQSPLDAATTEEIIHLYEDSMSVESVALKLKVGTAVAESRRCMSRLARRLP
jgi:hypothetical protein